MTTPANDSLVITLGDWQVYYNGWTGGPNTSFYIESLTGLGDLTIRDESFEKTEAHGGFTFARYATVRDVGLTGVIVAQTDAARVAAEAALQAAFGPQTEDQPFVFKRAGQSQQRIYGKVLRRSLPTHGREVRAEVVQFAVQIRCQDAFIYGDTDITGSASGGTAGSTTYGGVDFGG